jgi:hypothetical protein
MQEKKRFEGSLDDAVAAGMNAGVEVLMNQVSRTGGLCRDVLSDDFDFLRWSISFKLERNRGSIARRPTRTQSWDRRKHVPTLSHVWKFTVDYSKGVPRRRFWKCSTRKSGCGCRGESPMARLDEPCLTLYVYPTAFFRDTSNARSSRSTAGFR